MAGRFLCARAPKCRRGYVGAPLCAQSGSGLRVLASRGRAVPRWGGPNWPFAPNGYSRAAKARGPRSASALARSEVWPAGGFGAGGACPGARFWLSGYVRAVALRAFLLRAMQFTRPRRVSRCRSSQSPSCRTPGAPLPPKLRGPNRQTAPHTCLGVARRRKVRSPRDTMTAENR